MTTDADLEPPIQPKSKLDIFLAKLGPIGGSKPFLFFMIFLFLYLFVYAGIGVLAGNPTLVSATNQLILGNFTNVASALFAGIAAGASLTLVKHSHRRNVLAEESHRLTREMHTLLIRAQER